MKPVLNRRPTKTSPGRHLPVIYVSACQPTPSPAPRTPDSSRWLGSNPKGNFTLQQCLMLQRHYTIKPLNAVMLPVRRWTHSWVCFSHCWPSSWCHWWSPPGHPAFLGRRRAVVNRDPVEYKINWQHTLKSSQMMLRNHLLVFPFTVTSFSNVVQQVRLIIWSLHHSNDNPSYVGLVAVPSGLIQTFIFSSVLQNSDVTQFEK